MKLSGGQRQRIAIARVILKNAPILVLDEATSALDSEVEAAIQQSLGTLMAGKTVIAIAHRLSTIARMDRLIVLDGGRIVEQGSHHELLRLGGHYAALWRRQSGGFIDAAGRAGGGVVPMRPPDPDRAKLQACPVRFQPASGSLAALLPMVASQLVRLAQTDPVCMDCVRLRRANWRARGSGDHSRRRAHCISENGVWKFMVGSRAVDRGDRPADKFPGRMACA